MLVQIITENGQKKIIPLTADAGAGNPVGTIIVVCSNQIPSNYLPLGTQYDTSLYPVLYALLGTDTTPTASALGLPTLTSGQYAIKATSGLTENQQENVLNTINENLSYSTTEHKTGKKWIDGKDVWSTTIDCGTLPNATGKTVNFTANNIARITKIDAVADSSNYSLPLPYASSDSTEIVRLYVNKSGQVIINTNSDMTSYSATVTLEYTKTTDN